MPLVFLKTQKNVRDIREHAEEYLVGDFSKRATKRVENTSIEEVLGMKWTLIIGEKFYVGNVDVVEMILTAEKILPYLEEKS